MRNKRGQERETRESREKGYREQEMQDKGTRDER
jgi:hypothetical protein